MPDKTIASRYRVQFTPVGWHVIDTLEARDPIAQFGTGDGEYHRAKVAASALNAEGGGHDPDVEASS